MTEPNREIRWLSCMNRASETAPPFALMSLWIPSGRSDYSLFEQAEYDQQAVWYVDQPPGNAGTAVQHAPMYVCNGPQAIEPSGFGKCTCDWPARVRHDSSTGVIYPGYPCGPKANSWEIHSDGTAFTSLGYDIAAPLYGSQGDWFGRTTPVNWSWSRINTMWIAPPGLSRFQADGAAAGVAGIVAAGEKLELSGTWMAQDPSGNVAPTSDYKGMTVAFDGLYLCGFQATITSATAPNGATLRIDLTADDVLTGFYGTRKHIAESGYSLSVLAENVAFTGIVNLSAGQVLALRNSTGYPITVSAVQLWTSWLGLKHAS